MSAIDAGAGFVGTQKPFRLGQAAWLRALERTAPLAQHPNRTLPVLLNELSERFGASPALITAHETLSYAELAAKMNQYSRWAMEQDLAPGDSIGVLMPNCPEYLAIWLGISRVGRVAALLNTNIAGASLAHCINAAGARHVITSGGLFSQLASSLPHCAAEPEVWVHGGAQLGYRCIESAAGKLSAAALQRPESREVGLGDKALYIFTSGTTGLPKAANVSHHRVMAWSQWFAGMLDAQPADRLYNCLPFYHAIGGVAATGALLVSGGSVFLREKFSASVFWQEICQHECTLFQYIGDLCGYLLRAPESAWERDHRLRVCCGNGLSGDAWPTFKERYRIPHILEFYAATEANFSLYNVDEEPGAIGRVPAFLGHRFAIKLIKMDADSLEPVRSDENLCVTAAAGEVGEAVFRIAQDKSAGAASYEGYTSEADSNKKILTNVLAQGDAWYRSGDLMKKDDRGFFYFADRIGDTFRWKGENVSASEVTHAMLACKGVVEAAIYGVTVPYAEGRAGMGAITIGGSFDLASFKTHIDEYLPGYAQPLFLRIIDSLELTSTFRPKKAELVSQAYNPDIVQDPLYLNNLAQGEFVPLDVSLYSDIIGGRIKL